MDPTERLDDCLQSELSAVETYDLVLDRTHEPEDRQEAAGDSATITDCEERGSRRSSGPTARNRAPPRDCRGPSSESSSAARIFSARKRRFGPSTSSRSVASACTPRRSGRPERGEALQFIEEELLPEQRTGLTNCPVH